MYSHSKKIGNRGDLIKHFALTMALRDADCASAQFSYLDVHAGRRLYALQPRGEWQQGIGLFAEMCEQTEALDSDLHDFFVTQSLQGINTRREYYGSSEIVRRAIQQRGVERISLELCDIDTAVCDDLRESYQGFHGISIRCGDGYQRALDEEQWDLILIDPPNITFGDHFEPYMDAVRHCVRHKRRFISWNPLDGNPVQRTMSSACQKVRHFAIQNSVPIVSVRWTSGWSGQTCGCQMLFGVPGGQKIVDSCLGLSEFMGWISLDD